MYRIKTRKRVKQAPTACTETVVAADKRPPTLLDTGSDRPTSNRCASREGGGPSRGYLCCRGGTA